MHLHFYEDIEGRLGFPQASQLVSVLGELSSSKILERPQSFSFVTDKFL